MITIIELKISLRENHMKYPLFCSYGQVESRSNVRLTSGQWNVRKGEMIIYVAENQHYDWPVRLHTTSFLSFSFSLSVLVVVVVVVVGGVVVVVVGGGGGGGGDGVFLLFFSCFLSCSTDWYFPVCL